MKIKIPANPKINKLIGSGVYFKDELTVDWGRIEFRPLNIKGGIPRTGPKGPEKILNLLILFGSGDRI